MPINCTSGATSSASGGFGRRLPTGHRISHLVVGGGGGGGTGNGTATGGGGGAGAVRRSVRDLLTFGTTYAVVVGLGGAANTAGNSSSFRSITASGGGAGGVPGVNGGAGGNGGSGGGGAGGSGAPSVPSGAGTGATGGNAGGVGNSGAASFACAGGGGGAGGVGAAGVSASQIGGVGGVGISDNITGVAVFYGGGGGGANAGSGNPAAGGNGGGGAGVGTGAGVAGTANTGGGGGGGSANNAGGAGGSGVVILSIPTEFYSGIHTGSPTVTVSGSNTILKFTANGSYTAEYVAVPIDPNFAHVTLRLPFNGSFTDFSRSGLTATVNGSAAISTTTPLYGTGCLVQTVWGTDSISYASNEAFGYGTGDFTWDISFKIDTIQNSYILCHTGNEGVIAFLNGGRLYYYNTTVGVGSVLYTSGFGATSAFNDGNWHRLRVSRVSGVTYLFADGALAVSAADTHNYGSANALSVGSFISGGSNSLLGKIDEVRITKGVGRSTVSYQLEATEFPIQAADPFWSNVKLALSGDNNFTDTSTIGNTFTSTGPPTFDSTNYRFGTHAISCNGSNQYLTANSVTAFELGANDYCIEFWLYLDAALSASKALLSKGIAAGTAGDVWTLEGMSNGSIGWFPLASGAGALMQTSQVFATATWYHIAVVRRGSAHTIYVNGVSNATATASYTVATGGSFHIGRSWFDATTARQPNCNFDDIRITVGNARYTRNFTPPTAPLRVPVSNTILLVNFNGTNGSTTFTDLSSAAHTLTAGASAQITTTGPQFGTGALSIPGGNSFIGISGSPASMGFGPTDDFCIEFWVNPTSVSGPTFMDFRDGSVGGVVIFCSGGTLNIQSADGAFGISGGVVTPNTYSHIAFCRAAGVSRAFINGAQVGQSVADTNSYGTSPTLRFGCNANNTNPLDGKIDSIRIKRGLGAGIYTTNFNVPTVEFTVGDVHFPNVSALFRAEGINGGTVFTDSSIYANHGSVLKGTPTTSTTQTKYGNASFSFNGSSAIQLPNISAYNLGAGDFTIEWWQYLTTSLTQHDIIYNSGTTGTGFSWWVSKNTTTSFRASSTGTSTPDIADISFGTWSTGTWQHLAVTRAGNVFKTWLDGVEQATTTSSGSLTSGSPICLGGLTSGSLPNQINGYIEQFRITKGVARYSGTFTPPATAFPNY